MPRWLYYKILHTPGERGETTDSLLLDCIRPAMEHVRAASLAELWFFLRYVDADGFHVRLRLRCDGSAENEAHITDDLRHRLDWQPLPVEIISATYQPEIVKYGGVDGLATVERQFAVSSDYALECIEKTINRSAARLLVAAQTMQWTIAELTPRPTAQRVAIRAYADYWRRLVHERSGGPRIVDPRLAQLWESLQDTGVGLIHELELDEAEQRWRSGTREAITKLVRLHDEGTLQVDPVSIGLNLAHTFNNRLGLTVYSELIVTDLLLSG
jgi:thiopeptide-type bacteriocin biosynthesis protein